MIFHDPTLKDACRRELTNPHLDLEAEPYRIADADAVEAAVRFRLKKMMTPKRFTRDQIIVAWVTVRKNLSRDERERIREERRGAASV